jgi:CBS domain-containing protein
MAYRAIEPNAQRLRIYIGESDQWRGKPLYAVLLETLKREGMAGATVTRGVAGFGAQSHIHTAAILRLSEDLPLIIEVIDSPTNIQHALERISPMVREGLITLDEVKVISYTHRYLRPLPADRLVEEVMSREPVAVQADQTALEAWKIMLDKSLKALPVIDSEGRVTGLLTNEDLLDRAGLSARLAVAQKVDEATLNEEINTLRQSNLRVQDIMSQPVITIHPDDSIGLAAGRMVSNKITRLPVVDPSGRLVGMISRLDILRQVMDIPAATGKSAVPKEAGVLVREVMVEPVPLVNEETDLAGLVAAFISSGEHRLIVVNGEGKPVGLISDSDVIGRIQPHHRRGVLGALRGRTAPPDVNIPARELMSPGAETIPGDTTIVEAIRRMISNHRKWLVVVDDQGNPLGMVNREIVLESLIR